MMTPKLASYAVLLTYSICLACDRDSALPKAGHSFDWSKYNGTWYETVTTFDPIALDRACLTSSDVPRLMTGYGDDAIVYYDNGLKRTFRWHMINTKDGYFQHVNEDLKEIAAEGLDENGNINEESATESLAMIDSVHTYLGDSQHYVAYVRCSEYGWVIWIYTNVKTVSAELLLHIHNDLLKHGVSAPLRLSACKDIKDI